MRSLLCLFIGLAVAGCVHNTPAPAPAPDRWLAMCETRASTLRSLTTLREAGQLTPATTDRVTSLVLATRDLCSGDEPPATGAALQRLEANILQLVTIEGSAHAHSPH